VATFQIWKRKIFVSKKKVLQPKFKKKNQNLVLRVWFALLNYKKKHNNPEFGFQLAIFLPVFVFVKTQKISFPNVKI